MRAAPSASIRPAISASPTAAAPIARRIRRRCGTSSARRSPSRRPGRPVAGFFDRRAPFDDDLRAWHRSARASRAARLSAARLGRSPRIGAQRDASRSTRRSLDRDGATAPPSRSSPKIPLNRSYFDAILGALFRRASDLKVRGTASRTAPSSRARCGPRISVLRALPPARSLQPMTSRRGSRLRAADARGARRRRARAHTPRGPRGAARAPTPTSAAARCSRSWSTARKATTTRRTAATSRSSPAASRATARSATGSSTTSTRSTPKARKASLQRRCRSTTISAISTAGRPGTGRRTCWSPCCPTSRAAALVQSALGRVYNQFYRHQLVYYHPTTNCTSISVDTLRALGWDVPARGPTSRLAAWAGFPFSRRRRCRSRRPSSPSITSAPTRRGCCRPRRSRRSSVACLRSAASGSATAYAGGPLCADACAGSRRARVPALSAIPVEPRVGRRAGGDDMGVQDARPERSGDGADRSGPAAALPRSLRDADLLPPAPRPAVRRRRVTWGIG